MLRDEIARLRELLRGVERSWSFRAARTLGAPVRLLRALLGGR